MSEVESKKKYLGLIAIILLLVLIIFIVAGGMAYFFLLKDKNPVPREKPINKSTLDTFTVNLSDGNFRRYVRATMTLEYDNRNLAKELEIKKHRIRDSIISLLMSKRVADMADQKLIRQDLEKTINSHLTTGKINGIYFEEFIIQ